MARPRSRSARPQAPSAKPSAPIRPAYDRLGPSGYYAEHGHEYVNPHEPIVRRLISQWIDEHKPAENARILDLACGSGEVSAVFLERGYRGVTGVDPFTGHAYLRRTGFTAQPHDFVAIAQGALFADRFDVIFCSFALHLAEPGLLPQVCHRLTEIAPRLVIITPHKRPEIKPAWGWELIDERLDERVRLREYRRIE